jgi:hypothetical protein
MMPAKAKNIRLGGFFWFRFNGDSNQERGRENVSFPVAEELKPMGFRERSDVRVPSAPHYSEASLEASFLMGKMSFSHFRFFV